MTIGIIVNCTSVLIGGIIGSFLKSNVPVTLKENLPKLFGFCSIAIGVMKIGQTNQLAIVIVALVVGYIVGEMTHFDLKIERIFAKLLTITRSNVGDKKELYLLVAVLFCASSSGIFGTIQSVLLNDHDLLFSKSVLDFFTAIIFGSILGLSVSGISIIQFVVMTAVGLSAHGLATILNSSVLDNFVSLGSLISIIVGAKMSGMVELKTNNLLPAFVLCVIISLPFR